MPVELLWIFPGAPLTFDGATEIIQGNLNRWHFAYSYLNQCEWQRGDGVLLWNCLLMSPAGVVLSYKIPIIATRQCKILFPFLYFNITDNEQRNILILFASLL